MGSLDMIPSDLVSYYSCPYVIPSAQVWVRPGDLLLKNKIQQQLWDVTSWVKLQKTNFHLAHSLCWHFVLPLHLLTLMKQADML